MGRGTAASDTTSADMGIISKPRAVWLLAFTSPVTETADSLERVVSISKSPGSIFFFGMVTCTVPNLSLSVRKDMPPRFLMSCAQPLTVTMPSSALMLFVFLMRVI